MENTSAGDGDGIDVRIDSIQRKTLTGILCTFDKLKRDGEIKLLIGCEQEDVEGIQLRYGDIIHPKPHGGT